MVSNPRLTLLCTLLAATVVAACQPVPSPAGGSVASGASPAPAAVKRISMMVPNEPSILYYPLAPLSTRGSAGQVYWSLGTGLTLADGEGVLHALLSEQVPTIENGLWKLLPDGRMETTWSLRPGAAWHDGTPFTTEDLLFTLQVVQDRELPALANRNYQLIEDAEAADARTITITWKRPYIDADRAFSYQGNASFAIPLPAHLLQAAYATNKAGLLDLPYWSAEFVGTGPYRLDTWLRGSQLTLRAFDQYPLGRPHIDEIVVHFIPDQNTIISNVLAGAVDVYNGATLGVDQALQLRNEWQGGTTSIFPNNWVAIYPQFIDPQPPVVLNVQLRKALLTAIDRQAMVDSLMSGLVPTAFSPLAPSSREFKATEPSAVKYPYDPARAAQLIADIGYTRGPDGTFHDAAGQPLALEVRGAASRDIQVKGLFPVADYWRKVGVAADPVVISPQQASDLQDQATFRAFQLVRQDYGLLRLLAFHSSEARVPERNYTGANNGRYMNPDLDALINRYQQTIPWDERMEVGGQILHHETDQLSVLPLFYDLEVSLASRRMRNVTTLLTLGGGQVWDIHTWDLG